MVDVSGIGSWPGTEVREALTVVRDLLVPLDAADGVRGLPYLPELPARGPGADLIGRTAGLLVDLAVDLQPAGWRLVDRPGRDAARTAALWREDLDTLAAAFDGYAGPLKVTVAGPYTLAASLWLPRGDRCVIDPGAVRDVAESLGEGIRGLLQTVARAVPGAALTLQVDEPSLPAVLSGALPTASGYGRLPAVDPVDALPVLTGVLAAAGGRPTVIHCCAAYPPLPLLRRSGASALSVDTSLLTPRGWEGIAVAVEDGLRLAAGCVPTSGEAGDGPSLAASLARSWSDLGMPSARLAELTVTPSCGLAGLSPALAVARQRLAIDVARRLADRAQA